MRVHGGVMSIARVVEITATSDQSFEDAMRQGVARATQTLRNVRSAWIKEQEVSISEGEVVTFKVNMLVTFVLDEGDDISEDPVTPRQAARSAAKRPRR
jgi:flavin-binding protein dodecin